MRSLGVLVRSIILEFSLVVPPSLLVYVLTLKLRVALGVAGALLLVTTLVWAFAGPILLRVLGLSPEESSQGLQYTYDRATSGLALTGQSKLFVFSDPAPTLLMSRSLFGHGAIGVSRGLISTLSEDELRSALSAAVRSCREPQVPLQTFVAVLTCLLTRSGYRRTSSFLLLYPLCHYLWWLSGVRSNASLSRHELDRWPSRLNPASRQLHFFYPSRRSDMLSLQPST